MDVKSPAWSQKDMLSKQELGIYYKMYTDKQEN